MQAGTDDSPHPVALIFHLLMTQFQCGRGSVLGALIFGVLRNAMPQIPGATFYDRMIVGVGVGVIVIVIVIVVMDQLLVARSARQ